ncbi:MULTISPECIES: phosphoribosylformylglycinamidine synthase-associated small membrane protein [Roseibium]|uniref:Phosphoribosylformylglycinamidine synthase n=1 Tax=Roseibium polysiphoniae TaxID=2571221 RepID=A0A927Q2K4_9HYPH|nr:phosphoribosylformylglycinamidine synthase-associated small membrane protein [Roseibium polysiphoniae]MBD8876516.1 phosphoribosylformylglycinamidine synthase [Roseibium polysiphoniae]MBS8260124.1 phosphoribosylformylglycinamidine synthase [Roseibium polysiphoniae]
MDSDAKKALRFMALKAAIFIVFPALVAVVTVLVML